METLHFASSLGTLLFVILLTVIVADVFSVMITLLIIYFGCLSLLAVILILGYKEEQRRLRIVESERKLFLERLKRWDEGKESVL